MNINGLTRTPRTGQPDLQEQTQAGDGDRKNSAGTSLLHSELLRRQSPEARRLTSGTPPTRDWAVESGVQGQGKKQPEAGSGFSTQKKLDQDMKKKTKPPAGMKKGFLDQPKPDKK